MNSKNDGKYKRQEYMHEISIYECRGMFIIKVSS